MQLTRYQVAGSMGAVLALAMPLVMTWEGISRDPYVDLAGVLTVCRGETNVAMRRYTVAECDAMFERSLVKHAGPVLACLPPAAPVEVKAAFVSFGYNVGTKAACGSSAAKWARAGDYARACDGLLAWNKVKRGGKYVPVQGLTNRRQDERALCRRGLQA